MIARRILIPARLTTRSARAAVIAVALALVVVAPAAAAQPTRTVFPKTSLVDHFGAGSGCPFDVTVYLKPGARTTITSFSDGSTVYEAHSMKRVITSDVTGKTFVENLVFHDVERTDPATGVLHGVTSGQQIQTFWPGDVGPYGIVQQESSYQIDGTAWWAWDPATGQQPSFSYRGTITDICAALS
jgi:hypothetical protein